MVGSVTIVFVLLRMLYVYVFPNRGELGLMIFKAELYLNSISIYYKSLNLYKFGC